MDDKKYCIDSLEKFNKLQINYLISTIKIEIKDSFQTIYDKYVISGKLYNIVDKVDNKLKLQNIFNKSDIVFLNFEQIRDLNGHLCHSLPSEADYIIKFITDNENIEVNYEEMYQFIKNFKEQYDIENGINKNEIL